MTVLINLTDAFFFDGPSKVQKAGEILVAKFPHSFCFFPWRQACDLVVLLFGIKGKAYQAVEVEDL